MIDFHKSYGLPPHAEQQPFDMGDRVRLRNFPEPNRVPIVKADLPAVLVVSETRLMSDDNATGISKYQQIRIPDLGWSASYYWELDQ